MHITVVFAAVAVCLGSTHSLEDIDSFEPLQTEPVKRSCCPGGGLTYDLRTGNQYGGLDGAKLLKNLTLDPNNKKCDKTAELLVNFDKLDCYSHWIPDGCLSFAPCGRRVLKIDLYLDSSTSNRKGHMINIGDSKTNNGYGGDSNTQTNDAELHGLYPNITLYQSDKCLNKKGYKQVLEDALTVATHLTIYVTNEQVIVTDHNTLEEKFCHECLFALNGQTDATGPVNEDVYISLNEVIWGSSRVGEGLCKVKLEWQCPCLLKPYIN